MLQIPDEVPGDDEPMTINKKGGMAGGNSKCGDKDDDLEYEDEGDEIDASNVGPPVDDGGPRSVEGMFGLIPMMNPLAESDHRCSGWHLFECVMSWYGLAIRCVERLLGSIEAAEEEGWSWWGEERGG